MRTLIASALVLLPVLAHGQASTSTAAKPAAPASLQAKVVAPAPFVTAAAAKAPVAAAPTADELMVPVNETVVDTTAVPAIEAPNTPKLIHSTPLTLSLADMRAESDIATVVVHLTVGKDGVPTNLTIARSGGAALDRRALEAVAQYRFNAATQNGQPVEAPVDVKIQVKKS